MDYIDLVPLLKNFGQKGLSGVEVYGYITRQLKRPDNIFQNVTLQPNGIFVEMRLFAVNLKNYEGYLKQVGIYNKDSVYMVNGSIIMYIDPSGKRLPDWYASRGTLRFGTRDYTNTYVSLFDFRKTGDNWSINTNHLSNIEIGNWSRDSLYYQYIYKSYNSETVVVPEEVKNLQEFRSEMFELRPIESNSVAEQMKRYENGVAIKENGITFNKENRKDIAPKSEKLDKFKSILYDSKSSLNLFVKTLISDYSSDNSSKDYIKKLIKELKYYYVHSPGQSTLTGRAIIKKYLSNFKGNDKPYIGNVTAGKFLSDIFDDVSQFILDHSVIVNADGGAWDLCKVAFGHEERFYAGVVAVICGISYEDMLTAVFNCEKNNLSIVQILNKNPYMLRFVSSLSFDSIERLALCFGVNEKQELNKWRNIAMLEDYINGSESSSTYFTKDQIVAKGLGITLTKARFEMLKNAGYCLPVTVVASARCFLNHTTLNEYQTNAFKSINGKYVEVLPPKDAFQAIRDYIEVGLGVEIDGYITSVSLLDKELYVYEFMYALGSITYDYPTADIDKYIDEYENIVGFKLEKEQRMAVHLCIHGGFIIAGSAGAGKTTVSNCIVYVLDKLEPNLSKEFGAPTGKAAKRMQEVVKRPVQTLHSKFRIGMGEHLTIGEKDDSDLIGDNTAYFFDEGAMITIDLLYSVLKRLTTESTRVFLFGDFNQLPPIGKGLPFKNLLRFMPCVFLTVSKRAADGSSITRNSNYVNEYSDYGKFKDLESGGDFFLLPCKEESICSTIENICKHYIDGVGNSDTLPDIAGLTADDIQVVSPLGKPTYTWGTTALNTRLQPLFNKTRGYDNTFVYQLTNKSPESKFVINDRVIHINSNMYTMQWYTSYRDGEFQKCYGCGICNGEVGKIVAFLPADNCEFLEEVEPKPDDFEYRDNLRDDSTYRGEDKYFVVVEYYDYIDSRNIYILYRAELNTSVQNNRGIVLVGDDLTKLQLFYAGTTHKLQGSQSKVVICALGNVNYKGFITRQMIYTMFTRGSELVIVIGSVDNLQSSMLSKARHDISSVDTRTVGELLV